MSFFDRDWGVVCGRKRVKGRGVCVSERGFIWVSECVYIWVCEWVCVDIFVSVYYVCMIEWVCMRKWVCVYVYLCMYIGVSVVCVGMFVKEWVCMCANVWMNENVVK